MFREAFLGKNPSHFVVNRIVRAFIISESFLWSGWNLITPIFAVFVTTQVTHGNVQIAASAFSTYLITRVVSELVTGRLLFHSNDRVKFITAISGITCLSVAYLGFAYTHTVSPVYLFYALMGVGLGVASPAKNVLFAMHLDKNKESTEWGLSDGIAFLCMAAAATIGGFIAASYGFPTLFIVASIINIIATIPYLLYIR